MTDTPDMITREEADARVAAALREAASMFARQAEDMKRDGDGLAHSGDPWY